MFWFIIIGLLLLGAFSRHEERMTVAGKEPLLDVQLLKIPRLRVSQQPVQDLISSLSSFK